MPTQLERKLEKVRASAIGKYGKESVNVGKEHYRLNVVPTPSLMLDYKLGIGGLPYGHAVEVFGASRLGKSSAIGYGVLANVQKQGKLPALIAVEPRLVTPDDREWALSLGLNPDEMFIEYPDNAEEAFDMLRDLVFGNEVDYIMIDSLGGMGSEAGSQEGGRKQAYGISSTVTSGLNDIMPRLHKNQIGLLIINQQRQKTGGKPGQIFYDSPGGEALKHHMRIRIHLKPGATRYTTNIEGESVLVGRELTCKMVKNNMKMGQEKTAKFDFFHIRTEQYGFGVDVTQDIINTGKVTGVLKGGAWIEHSTFPETKSGKRSLNGKAAVGEFLADNPKAYATIRKEVMEVMIREELEAARKKREAEQSASVSTEKETDDE